MKKLLYLLFAAGVLTLSSCKKEPVELSIPQQKAKTLAEKFEAGALLSSFGKKTTNDYQITFKDGSSLLVAATQVRILECNLNSWTSVVKGNDDFWVINGTKTSIAYTTDPKQEELVALLYDTEGLYAFVSSGRILFFHPDAAREVGCFRFLKAINPALTADVICSVAGNPAEVSTIVPRGVDLTKLKPTIAYRGAIKYDGKPFISGSTEVDFSGDVVFETGSKNLTAKISTRKRIPVLRINTDGSLPVDTKETYRNATITIEDPDLLYSTSATTELRTQIRGRGNSTWGMPKKPYRLKLDVKTQMFGMSSDRDWAMLANYADKTLLRNIAAFEMSHILGMSWTPLCRPVELYLNGSYDGQYMFTEHVKVSSERVNITLAGANDNSGEAITGGYFLEIDERMGEVTHFWTGRGVPINFKDPEYPTAEQLAYVMQYFADAETALYGENFKDNTTGYAKYIDVVSFARNYIIQELTKNVDGNMRLSNYLVKERGGKIAHSHIWDFDLTLGNCDYVPGDNPVGSPNGFLIKSARWYDRLMQDPAFVALVKEEWVRLYSQLYIVEANVREMALQIDESQKRNFQRWNILNTKVWPNVVALGSYNAELEYMLKFMNDRAKWLNTAIMAL